MKSIYQTIQLAICILIVSLLLVACNSKKKEEAAMAMPGGSYATVSSENAVEDMSANKSEEVTAEALAAPPPPTTITPSPTLDKNSVDSIGKKIIKDGTITWETIDLKKTQALVKNLAASYHAYISNETSTSDDYRVNYSLELRIPSSDFDAYVNALEKEVSDFDEKNISAQDVTEEYIDVYARIKAKKELEQRYFGILNRANKVEDILKVEEYLNTVRNDIESAEGRMRYMNDRISLSTLHLNFYQSSKTTSGFGHDIINSFATGWKGILNFILVLIKLWPFLLIIGAGVFWIVRVRRR